LRALSFNKSRQSVSQFVCCFVIEGGGGMDFLLFLKW